MLRGIAIVAVVAIHAIPWQYYQKYGYMSYRQLLNFCVPMFFFMSGYWMAQKTIGTLKEYGLFLRKRFLRILVPYVFWSFVYIGYEVVKTHEISMAQVLQKLLTGQACFPTNHLYFIVVIAQFYSLTPLLMFINRKKYLIILVILFNMIWLYILNSIRLSGYWSCYNQHFLVHGPFYSWIVFYQVGLLIGGLHKKLFVQRKFLLFILPAILVSLAISAIDAIYILSAYRDWQTAACFLRYSSFLYSFCVIFGFLALRNHIRTWPKFLVLLGKYSFGIYLMHMIILRGIVRALQNAQTLYSFQPLYEFIVVSMTLLGCCAVIAISRKILPRPVYGRVLGF